MGELNGGAKHGCRRGEAPIVPGETADMISGREWHIGCILLYPDNSHYPNRSNQVKNQDPVTSGRIRQWPSSSLPRWLT